MSKHNYSGQFTNPLHIFSKAFAGAKCEKKRIFMAAPPSPYLVETMHPNLGLISRKVSKKNPWFGREVASFEIIFF